MQIYNYFLYRKRYFRVFVIFSRFGAKIPENGARKGKNRQFGAKKARIGAGMEKNRRFGAKIPENGAGGAETPSSGRGHPRPRGAGRCPLDTSSAIRVSSLTQRAGRRRQWKGPSEQVKDLRNESRERESPAEGAGAEGLFPRMNYESIAWQAVMAIRL